MSQIYVQTSSALIIEHGTRTTQSRKYDIVQYQKYITDYDNVVQYNTTYHIVDDTAENCCDSNNLLRHVTTLRGPRHTNVSTGIKN